MSPLLMTDSDRSEGTKSNFLPLDYKIFKETREVTAGGFTRRRQDCILHKS